jgi:pre-mRNA-splicing factor SYF1
LFKWPNVFDIWNTYLTEFLERYGGTKLERARDLFEQCLETCPEKFAKAIYILYAKLELEHGSAKRGKGPYFNYISTFLTIFDQLSNLVK